MPPLVVTATALSSTTVLWKFWKLLGSKVLCSDTEPLLLAGLRMALRNRTTSTEQCNE